MTKAKEMKRMNELAARQNGLFSKMAFHHRNERWLAERYAKAETNERMKKDFARLAREHGDAEIFYWRKHFAITN